MHRSTYLNSHLFHKVVKQGWALAFYKGLVHFTKGKLHDKILAKKIELVKKKVAQYEFDLSCVATEDSICEDKIWVCWFQGEDNMPEIIKLCYDSIKKHAAGHDVVLLTQTNFREWVAMPDKYYEQLCKGGLLPSQFADLLRINLLSQRGGLWLDATIYVLSDIPEWYFNRTFYSMKMLPDGIDISKSRWTSYCLGRGSKNNPVFSRLALFFDRYMESHNEFIDYFLLDYAIDYIYDKYQDAKEAISALPMNNVNTTKLWLHLCDKYDEQKFSQFTKDTVFFKLRYRAYEFDVANLKNGKDNVYCHLRELVYGKVE